MRHHHAAAIVVALAIVGPDTAPPATAIVWGGGPSRSDCYVAWQVTSSELSASRGGSRVDCQDGDAACDLDGTQDNACTFGVSVCAFQAGIAGCTPQATTTITLSRRAQELGLQSPPTPVSQPACGPASVLTLPLRARREGTKASRPLKLKVTALTDGKPRKDIDTLVLRCVPNTGLGRCPTNPNGGPSDVMLTIGREGTDLDNGWKGLSHNFPVVFGAELRVCMTDCDAGTNPLCHGDEATTDQVNGPTFGAPLPLFSAGVPVCVVNRFASPKMQNVSASLQTGEISARVNLLSDVYVTGDPLRVCPRCSGKDLGQVGTCDSGARARQACRTGGVATVAQAAGDKTFTVSADCLPGGTPATLTIALPVTTGTTRLPGPKPCPGQPFDDDCSRPGGVGGTCTAPCTGAACVASTGDGRCIDMNGGISQVCCSGDSTRACFPTAGGGEIVRTGRPGVPTPAWPDPTYPKTAAAVVVATFCEAGTGTAIVDNVTGLPGPGALILPVEQTWSQ